MQGKTRLPTIRGWEVMCNETRMEALQNLVDDAVDKEQTRIVGIILHRMPRSRLRRNIINEIKWK